VLSHLAEDRPGLPVVGGLASGAVAPGGNRLVVDDRVVTDGAVGAYLGPGVDVTSVVSQGCRPVGDPFVITRAEGNIVYELAGKPALERLQDVARTLDEGDRQLLSQGVHLGRVIDESKTTFGPGDFLVRNVLGGDPSNGAIAVGDLVEVGSTAQFQVRDAASADADLRHLLDGRQADAALVFTCNGRGTRLFGRPDHDAEAVAEGFPGAAVAGMFCAGELGPVGRKNFLHGFTASVVLFRDSQA
jgi:small ligand-binding sensory domain FIST